jgi:pimeloyl-ACP methyl ester carboxylesterase
VSPPVVLVHGLTASTYFWRSTIAALEPEYDVRVVQLPGIPYREAADWLGDWLIREGVTGATVVGHSMGGTVALLTAAENPGAVGRLVLIAPAGIFAKRRRRTHILPLLRSVGGNPRRVILAARDVVRIGPLRLWRVGSDLLAGDIAPVLGSVQVPTLLVWGESDRVVPPSVASVFCEEIPDARLVILEGCGHVPMLEAASGLNAALFAFLEEAADDGG